jgi:hypothetical protein
MVLLLQHSSFFFLQRSKVRDFAIARLLGSRKGASEDTEAAGAAAGGAAAGGDAKKPAAAAPAKAAAAPAKA